MNRVEVLLAPDLAYATSPASRAWITAVCDDLSALGYTIRFHPRERDADEFHAQLVERGVLLLPYEGSPDEEDGSGHLARFRARSIIRAHEHQKFRWVIAQGIELSRLLAGSGRLGEVLWSIVADAPYRDDPMPPEQTAALQKLQGSYRVLVTSETNRSFVEAETPSLSGRVGVMEVTGAFEKRERLAPPSSPDLLVDLEYFTAETVPSLTDYSRAARERRDVPELFLVGGGTAANLPVWRDAPGLVRSNGLEVPARFGLLPVEGALARRAAAEAYRSRGIVPVSVGIEEPGVAYVASSDLLLDLGSATAVVEGQAVPERTWFPPATPNVVLSTPRAVKLVLAGADFKFAGDLIESLVRHPQIDLRVDLFAYNAKAQPEASAPYLDWADIIIAEFASQNAIWYSQNVRPHQRLVVHLHGYELLADWIDDLNIDNVAAVVVASHFYRERALAMKGWPPEKVVVIGNSVDVTDLLREKAEDARFHLGIAGIVPTLKRPDRAAELLRQLRAVDPRYVLHVRGHAPWDYAWEWKKSAHQDAYRAFYRALGGADLREAVSFEPFGADMGNWLRRIGWILSPSSRETFHLAGIEGAASGAVPLVWEREGSREIFSERWNFASTEDIAEFVLRTNRDRATYDAESRTAVAHAERYSVNTISKAWLLLLDRVGIHDDVVESTIEPAHLTAMSSIRSAMAAEGYEGALRQLDELVSVTARATGPLKDLEMWVRGVAALDARRYHLFPGGAAVPAQGVNPVTVRASGDASEELARLGLERRTVDIEPPHALRPSGLHRSSDIQFDRPDVLLDGPASIRGDRYLELMGAALGVELAEGNHDVVVAHGAWWVALPAALAADRRGIPFYWVATRAEDLRAAARAFDARFGGDHEEQVVLRIVHQAAGLVDVHGALAGTALQSVCRLVSLDAIARVTSGGSDESVRPVAGAALRNYEGVRSAILRPPPDVRAIVVGGTRVRSMIGAGGVIVETPGRAELLSSLTPEVDLFVVDGSLLDDPAWRSFVSGETPTASKCASVFDKARGLGITTVFVPDPLVGVPKSVLATARKADVIVADRQAAVEELLGLNPISTRSVVLVPSSKAWDDGELLRHLGLSITTRSNRALKQTSESTQDAAVEEVDAPDSLPPLEGISLVLATHAGRPRILQMLESIAGQTLPGSLLEVIVVENGAPDGTADVVSRFADLHPHLAVRYQHVPEPRVGNARNIGVRLATRDYVTFVDDDDTLEPNFLLSMWLTAGPQEVVIGTLTDVHADGRLNTNTATTRRVIALNESRLPVAQRVGVLGLNACKLIPRDIAAQMKYPLDLRSGEDVVYMAQLLRMGVEVVPAAPIESSAYLRLLRDESVSRRDLDFGFAVEERLHVLRELESQRDGLGSKQAAGALSYLESGQVGFISRYLEREPQDRDRARTCAEELGLMATELWPALAKALDS